MIKMDTLSMDSKRCLHKLSQSDTVFILDSEFGNPTDRSTASTRR